MNLVLVVKNAGSISHWKEDGKNRALCGTAPQPRNIGRTGWKMWMDQRTEGKSICPKCAKLKLAHEKLKDLGLCEVKHDD